MFGLSQTIRILWVKTRKETASMLQSSRVWIAHGYWHEFAKLLSRFDVYYRCDRAGYGAGCGGSFFLSTLPLRLKAVPFCMQFHGIRRFPDEGRFSLLRYFLSAL